MLVSFMKRCGFILVLMFFPIIVYPQSDTVVVQWSTSWGSICGGPTGNYACVLATGSPDWDNGLRDFTDPIPPGNILKAVVVTVYKVDCGVNTLTVTLNGDVISTECCVGTCNEGECWPTEHVRSEPGGFTNYVYGGTNTLQLIPDTTDVCVDRAEIILYYVDTVFITSSIDTPQICMVTVDTLTNKNTIVWDKTMYPALSYNIYKETSPNVFSNIGNVPYSDLSIFTDASSNPDTLPERYKISAVGSCNSESALSDPHKTIQLTASIDTIGFGVNLVWNAYEGFAFSQYSIWRGTDSSGMTLHSSVPSSTTTYTDVAAPPSNVCYLIEAVHPSGCTATDPPTNYSSALSNISCKYDTNSVDVKKIYRSEIVVDVYPNPFNLTTTFEVEGMTSGLLTFDLYDLVGKRVKLITDINGSTFTINRDDLSDGIYIYKIRDNKKLIGTGKLVVN